MTDVKKGLFATNGTIKDPRAEVMIHHYAVMLYDDFLNDAKVEHIENRLRDLLRNYDENVRWGYPYFKSPPLVEPSVLDEFKSYTDDRTYENDPRE